MDEVRDMRPMLLSVAKGILDSDEEAEDVVQDAMLRLWQLREEPIRNPKGFARTVVRNLSLSKVRRRPLTVDIGQADMALHESLEIALTVKRCLKHDAVRLVEDRVRQHLLIGISTRIHLPVCDSL